MVKKDRLKIEYIPVEEIKPYENNAKIHSKAQIETIANSITEFGFNDPVALWRGEIVAGHGRMLAAQELGMKTVPVIRLDKLTNAQRRAYALAHNKTAELAEWDYDLLDAELNDLPEFDFGDFGFEVRDYLDHEIEEERTQKRVESILGLEKGVYKADGGLYDIPQLNPVFELPEIREWIGFNYVLSDKDPEGKAVHFFIDDYQFERLWKEPEKYVEKLSRYACVATPDFSPYADMPMACQIYNHYRKHWVGAFLQSNGLTVIPTIRASTDERSLGWYLEGEPHGGIVLISNMWTKTAEGKAYFMREYETMRNTLNPCKIFVYGKEMQLEGNTEFIKSFTNKRWGN